MKATMTSKTQLIPQTHAGRVISDLMATVDQAIARVRQQIQQKGTTQ